MPLYTTPDRQRRSESMSEPPPPPNKLQEWGAAVAIMVVLSFIAYVLLSFLRGARL